MGNRRQHKRLKLARSVRVPVQISPVMPFLGKNIEAMLLNFSSGGMSLSIEDSASVKKLKRGTVLKIHFHMPGSYLFECQAEITHRMASPANGIILGIRFVKPSLALVKEIEKIVDDFEICEARMSADAEPWCDVLCSFHNLCRKPFRVISPHIHHNQIEFSLQIDEETLAA